MELPASESKLGRKSTNEMHHSGSAKSIGQTLKWPTESGKCHKYNRSIDVYPPELQDSQSDRKNSIVDTDGGNAEERTDSCKTRSLDQPGMSEMSVQSHTSGSRYSFRSFNSCTDEIMSVGTDSGYLPTKISHEKKESQEFGHRKNYVYITLTTFDCFSWQIGKSLIASKPSSLKAFYMKVCDLLAFYANHSSSMFAKPIRETLYTKSMVINRSAKVEADELLSQIFWVADDVAFLLFVRTFFLNIFELVMTPVRLLLLIIQEFFVEPHTGLTIEERHIMREKLGAKGTGIRDRILFFIETWIKKREKDFLLGRPELLELLICFLKYAKEKKTIILAHNARFATLSQLVRHLKDRKKKILVSSETISGSYRKMFHSLAEERLYEEKNMSDFFYSMSNDDIAITLFVIDASIFLKMNVYELNPKRINSVKFRSEAYSNYIFRLNTFTYLIVWLMLCQPTMKHRLLMIKKLVSLAIQLRLHAPMNIEAYHQIRLALIQPSIRELKACHILLHQKTLNGSLNESELAEYHRMIDHSSAHDDIDVIMETMKAASLPCVPSVRPFVQYISRSNDKWQTTEQAAEGRNTVNLNKLCKFNDIYNFMDKMHVNEKTRSFLRDAEVYCRMPLYYFLQSGYQAYLASSLNIKNIDSFETQDALYRYSSKLQGRSSI